jgi:hypothetical protein
MYERNRGAPAEADFDRFAHRTLQGPDGITTWLECYRKPPAASKTVTKTMTLIAFGHALHGFPSIVRNVYVRTACETNTDLVHTSLVPRRRNPGGHG